MRLPWHKLMSFRVSSFIAATTNPSQPLTSSLHPQQPLRGPFLRDQVRVRLSPAFNRSLHPNAALESSIDAVWKEYKERSPRLFNATKFRLQAISEESDQSVHLHTLVLDWGLTDYKTYLGTCCSASVTCFIADGQALRDNSEANEDEFAYLSRKVGVAAVVETCDAHIALIKRSKSVGVYQDMYDTPGGHPEPSVSALFYN